MAVSYSAKYFGSLRGAVQLNKNDVSIGSSVSHSKKTGFPRGLEITHSLIETGTKAVRWRTEALKEKRDAEDIDPMVDCPSIQHGINFRIVCSDSLQMGTVDAFKKA